MILRNKLNMSLALAVGNSASSKSKRCVQDKSMSSAVGPRRGSAANAVLARAALNFFKLALNPLNPKP